MSAVKQTVTSSALRKPTPSFWQSQNLRSRLRSSLSRFCTSALAAVLWLLATQPAQPQLGQLDPPRPKPKQLVVYASEAQVIPAGKRVTLELRFHVQPGYHVNSHTPNSDLQIPTAVAFQPDASVHLEPALYPSGKTYTLSFNPGEKLDVYTGDFTVKLPILAQPGTHQLHGELKYQACDQAACYPLKTLPLDILFTAN